VLEFAAATYPAARSKLPATVAAITATPGVRPQGFNFLNRVIDLDGTSTPRSSNAGSPAPESGTPAERAGTPSARDENEGPSGGGGGTGGVNPDPLLFNERQRLAEEADRILPIMPLDQAILESVRKGCRGEDKKMRDFFGGIMIVGGGAKMPGFTTYLEYRLRNLMPGFTKEILAGLPPREMDQEQVAWKGGTVFGRLSSSGNDSWIYQKEYDLLGAKLLYQKLMFAF
jgi:actin-related protein 8